MAVAPARSRCRDRVSSVQSIAEAGIGIDEACLKSMKSRLAMMRAANVRCDTQRSDALGQQQQRSKYFDMVGVN